MQYFLALKLLRLRRAPLSKIKYGQLRRRRPGIKTLRRSWVCMPGGCGILRLRQRQ